MPSVPRKPLLSDLAIRGEQLHSSCSLQTQLFNPRVNRSHFLDCDAENGPALFKVPFCQASAPAVKPFVSFQTYEDHGILRDVRSNIRVLQDVFFKLKNQVQILFYHFFV